jgi:hypothetical protein
LRVALKITACAFLILLLLISLPFIASGQSHNYWTRSFNEESSLLSGAVVGGGSGPSAIYYNPAGISEVVISKFTLNASLFSFDFVNIKNALGDSVDLISTRGKIEPRFISYMIKSKRFKNWSFEIAILNNENVKTELNQSVDKRIDILTNIQGNERYYAYYKYSDQFHDDWIGGGGSVKLNENLFVGISMFVAIKSANYTNSLDIEAYSLKDSIFINNEYVPFYSASYQRSEYLKYNDYRLLWKAGIYYKLENVSIGFSLTTPSIGKIYSDGKRVTRQEKQNNITQPGTGEPVPDYVIADYKEKGEMQVNYKTPFSAAAGITYSIPEKQRTLYFSFEYFSGIDPYRMVEADESPDIAGGIEFQGSFQTDWLTYLGGARALMNAAIGYSWTLKKDLRLMAGFRTDFNSRKNFDNGNYENLKRVQNINTDLYHISGGLSWTVFGQNIITGLQYTVGSNKNQQQIANLSNPVEYNPTESLPLQGTPNNNMKSLYNSVSLYFGASFNFGGKKK